MLISAKGCFNLNLKSEDTQTNFFYMKTTLQLNFIFYIKAVKESACIMYCTKLN